MPFASYSTLGEAAKAFRITCIRENFVEPQALSLADHFRAQIAFVQQRVAFDSSEFAVCESLIYPILQEVWKSYLDDFHLWSHVPLNFSAELSGTPDYFLARQSPLGYAVVDKPYLLIVEAKKDDFQRGWGQCLAAMLAAQRLNELPDQVLYGIAASGRTWEFGKLHADCFTQDMRPFTLSDLDEVCAAVNFAFTQCRNQLVAQPATT